MKPDLEHGSLDQLVQWENKSFENDKSISDALSAAVDAGVEHEDEIAGFMDDIADIREGLERIER